MEALLSRKRLGATGAGPTRAAANVAALVGLVACVAAAALVFAGTGPALLGYSSYTILGSSMEPSIPAGSIVVSRPTPPSSLRVGDVVTFGLREGPGTVVTHRIAALEPAGTESVLATTKGDANKNADFEAVVFDSNVERVVYSVPVSGYILSFARSREGMILLLVVPAVGLFALDLLGRRRVRRDAEAI